MRPLPTLKAATKLHTARRLLEAGVIHPERPDRVVAAARALARWGATPAGGYALAAARDPDGTALVDERGVLAFAELDGRINAVGRGLRADGVREGDRVAVMCRNHRGFVEATAACLRLGCQVVLFNTAFAGPQLADVARREAPAAIIHDEEFGPMLDQAGQGRRRYLAWTEDAAQAPGTTLEALARGDGSLLEPPSRPGRAVILTSGTTGIPKGAGHAQPRNLDPAASLLSRIPLRARERTMVAAPLFHAWGFIHFVLGMALSSTLVLRRRFDPEDTLRAVAEHGCTALVVVPVMLQRILELDEAVRRRYDLSRLRVVAASGSALPAGLAHRWMDAFGENLYNLYGSAEVAWAAIATPEDLRGAANTAGKVPYGVVVRVYDDDGRPAPTGQTGHIYVGNELRFEEYTGGGAKDERDGLVASGDLGHFDAQGRLFVDGRADDMIVSGGENVFPAEVEDLLAGHPAVADVAVFGVPDERFGQRLKAVVVPRPDAAPTAEELKAHVKANLATFKVPRDVVFVEELPRTATGKVLKRELADA
jgi:fatty-acyl-CoA synthase